MTSNEMKETIRNKINEAWDDYAFMKRTYGIESYESRSSRHAWCLLFDLWDTLFPTENWRS